MTGPAEGRAGGRAERRNATRPDDPAERTTEGPTARQPEGQTGRPPGGQTGRPAGGQTGKRAEGQTGVRAGGQIGRRAEARADARAEGPRIAVDAMGGDHGPEEIVAGAVAAVREHGVRLVLVGQARRVRDLLREHGALGEVPIAHAEDALAMDEGALAGWRRPRSSVAVACHLIRRGHAAALVSAGSTGGVVATSRLRLRGQPGVMRPALAVVLPTRPRPTVLLDAGATADAKPEMLVQFATLGTAYARIRLGVESPRVGLLTIGEEAGKGNKLTRRAHELLSGDVPGVHFVGNVEGTDLLTGAVDVVVTDGFTGNIALKTVEGAVRLAVTEMRTAIGSSRIARVAALLQRRQLRGLRDRLDPETHGGGVLLGLNGTVVIAHGASRATGVAAACVLARDLAAGRIVEQIGEGLAAARPHRFPRRGHGEPDTDEP